MKDLIYVLEKNYVKFNRAIGHFEYEPCDEDMSAYATKDEGLRALKDCKPEAGSSIITYSLMEYAMLTEDEQKEAFECSDNLKPLSKADLIRGFNDGKVTFLVDYLDDDHQSQECVARYEVSYDADNDVVFDLYVRDEM